MSWKGFKKALERMPHQLQSKIGRGAKTVDTDFDDLKARFIELEADTKQLFAQTAQFRDSIRATLLYQTSYLEQILAVYRPISTDPDGTAQPVGSYVDEGASPELLRVAEEFHRRVVAIKQSIEPQLGSLDISIVGPIQEMMAMMRNVHKVIQKRDHKMMDYDRHRVAVEKAEAKESTDGHRMLSEEKSYQKNSAQYQDAARQYTYFNDMLKAELKQMLDLRQAFIDPIFVKFFRIQHQLYDSLFREFSDAARNCPAFDLTTPVVVGWQNKWAKAEQNLAAIDLWGHGNMVVVPVKLDESKAGMMDTVRGTFSKKDKPAGYKPAAAGVFASQGGATPPSGASSPYGTVSPYKGKDLLVPEPKPLPVAGNYPYGGANPYSGDKSPAMLGAAAGSGSVAIFEAAKSPYGTYQSSFPPSSSSQQQQQHATPPPAAASPYIAHTAASPSSYGPGAYSAAPVEKPMVTLPGGSGSSGAQYVEALYDYIAQAQGDLEFKEGDRIELLKQTEAKDDWWTGRLRGVVGVFPGTYVTDPK
ncbi:BAR adaptor protein Hob1 [Kickxella alabastrina]|uniref:BAR adaptor protein Hob1 n=1 Tax=Kickxella alabastrina TaxID=61397 RepID=A0ACC1INZ9_9FUNG|nr:BAR adaptor protein Hob1 [Kickxella alabastrina]